MFRRDTEHMLKTERIELVRQRLAHRRVDLIDRQCDGLAEFAQDDSQFAIDAGDLGTSIYDKDDVNGLLQGDMRLAEYLTRY